MTRSEPSAQDVEPVRMTVRVSRNVEDAFDLFTRDIGSWWPLEKASFGGDRASELHMEPFVGGRFYERYIDGKSTPDAGCCAGNLPDWSPTPGNTTTGPRPPKSKCGSSRKNPP